MSLRGDTVDASVVAARRGLFDALEVLGPHASRVVLVGAQAVYVHTQGVVTGVALFTKDADVMLIPPIASAPDIEAAMVAGGFVPGEQPGIWWSGDGDREVDLLVPAALRPAQPSCSKARGPWSEHRTAGARDRGGDC